MPYAIRRQQGRYCVIKDDGTVMGCHRSRPKAARQHAALYASERVEKAKRIVGNLGRGAGGQFVALNGGGGDTASSRESFKLTPAAQEAVARGNAAAARMRREREQAGAAPKRERDQARSAPARSRGAQARRNRRIQQREQQRSGGRGSSSSARSPKQTKEEKQAQGRASVAQAITPDLQGADLEALYQLADGGTPDPAALAKLAPLGLVDQDAEGAYRLSSQGRSLITAANRGDNGAAKQALARGLARVRDRAAKDRERAAKQQDRRRRVREPAPKGTPRRKAEPGISGMAVFKAQDGQARWLAVSSTAFRDREEEIVSRAALEAAVARLDAKIKAGEAQDYGPLLWWHTPIELGRCDISAVHGRCLIEGGTFHSPEIAAATKAGDLQVSIGYHPLALDADGDSLDILLLERSVAPRGQVINPWTAFIPTEDHMTISDEKLKALQARYDSDLLARLLGATEETEQALDAAGIRSKAEEPEAVAAPDAPDAEEPEELEEPEEPEDGLSLSAEDMAAVAEIVTKAVDAVVGAKLQPLLDAITAAAPLREKAQAEAAAKIGALTDLVVAVDTRLQTLEGQRPSDLPGFVASAAEETKVKAAAPGTGPTFDPNFLSFFTQ